MNRRPIVFAFVAALLALGAAGLLVARSPWGRHEAIHTGHQAAVGTGPIIYYRDPDGPFFSAAPKKNAAGKDYVAVRASEDVGFDEKPWAAAEPAQQQSSGRRIRITATPWVCLIRRPSPRKTRWAWITCRSTRTRLRMRRRLRSAPESCKQRGSARSPSNGARSPSPFVQRGASTLIRVGRRLSLFASRASSNSVQKVAEGDYVHKGQSLMRVYGPDLSSAAAEYVAVLNSGPPARVEGARRRLVNLGLDDATIASIARSRRVPRVIDWPAPQSGHVVERAALSGMRAAPGETLFRIVDHSLVWVLADVPERDVSSIKPGEPALIRVRSYPDRPFKGQVALVYPHLNMETRTARVRIELPNPDGLLLGDMFADVEIDAGGKQKALAVPESAVIDAGKRQVVILDKGEGRFQPREVKIGRRGEGYAEITSGLAEGDRVVTAANFLIDAESNLKAALQALDQGGGK